MKTKIFTGAATAIATPFSDTGVDYESFGRHIEMQIENGINALVVCGTTGKNRKKRDLFWGLLTTATCLGNLFLLYWEVFQ